MERLLRKLGYVKLDKYGLYLTPDGRIVSADGKPVEGADPGGYEVGAAAQVAKPAGPITFPGRDSAAVPVPQPVLQPSQPTPPAPQPIAQPPQPAFTPNFARAEAAAVATQPPAPVETTSDEDEWEWQLALARARAAAEDTEAVVAAPPQPQPQSAPVRELAPSTPPTPPRDWVRPDATPIRAKDQPSAPVRAKAPTVPPAVPVTPFARTPSAPVPSAPMPRTPTAQNAVPSAPMPRTPSTRTAITSDRSATASGTTQVRPAPTAPTAPRTPATKSNDEVTRKVAYPAAPVSQRVTAARPIESPRNPLAPVVRSSPAARAPLARSPQAQVPAQRPPLAQPHRPVGEDTVRTTAVAEAADPTDAIGDVTTQTTAVHHRSVGDETTRTHAAPPPPPKKAASDGAPRPMSTRTVIPVPELPSMDQTQPALRLEPVVRARPAAPPMPPQPAPHAQRATPPRRFPRGTDQVEPQPAAQPPAPPRLAGAPANDSAPLPRVTKRFANS